jgi:TRAP-type C4-dicarboxylate transport system substrate-binding protein
MKGGLIMKKIILVNLFVILITGLILSGCAKKEAPKVVLREALVHASTDEIGAETIKMGERFNARVKGYVIEVHTGGDLVQMPELLDAGRMGTVEIVQFPIGVFSNAEPTFASAELPFLYNNLEANIAALDMLLEDYSAVLEKKYNQKALCVFTATSLDLLSRKPVRNMKDWKGLLVQAINPPTATTIQTLGGSPVSIPWPDAYTSLDKGVVDGTMVATTQMVNYKLNEVAKYVVPIYIVPTGMIATINLDVWKKIPKDVQDILIEEHKKTAKILNDTWITLCPKQLVILKDRGVEIVSIPQAERDKWRAALTPFTEKSLTDMGDFGKRVKEVAKTVNDKYPYKP